MGNILCQYKGSTYHHLDDICGSDKENGYIFLGIGSDNIRKIILELFSKNGILTYATGNPQDVISLLKDPGLAQKHLRSKVKGCLCAIFEDMGEGFPGISLLQEIRADEDLEGLLVIIISGDANNEVIGQAVEAGANGYITIAEGIILDTIEKKLLKVVNDRADPPLYVKLIKAGEASLEKKDVENATKLFDGALETYYKIAVVKADHIITDALKRGKLFTTEKKANAERFIEKARESKKGGDNEKAVERFEKALEYLRETAKLKEFRNNKSASLARILNLVAKARELNGEAKEAEKYYEQAVEVNPLSLKACVEMVRVSEKKGDKKAAMKYLKQVNSINPRNPERQRHFGEMCLEAGDVEGAQKAFDHAIQADPGSINKISQLCLNAENTELASHFLKKAVLVSKREGSGADFSQDVVDQYNELGRQLRQDGRYTQAVVEFDRALQVSPNDARLMFNKGRAFYDWGRKEQSKKMEARQYFVKAAEIFLKKGDVDEKLEKGLNVYLEKFGSSLDHLR